MSKQDLELMKKIFQMLLVNAQTVSELGIDLKEVRGLYLKLITKKD